MKRTGKLIIVILILATSGLFSACSTATTEKPTESEASISVSATDDPKTSAPESTPAPVSAQAPSPSSSSAAPSGFVFEEKLYSEGTVAIKYPQIIDMADSAAQEKLNKIISEAALKDLSFLESGTEYELNYEVTFNNPSFISMYFDAYSYTPGAAHPNQFLRTVTIDVEKQETVPLQALVSVSVSFVDVLFNGKYRSQSYEMTDEYETAIKDYLTEMDSESWVNDLKNADSDSAVVYSYLDENALVISVSVPHVMGDHVEISLTFKDLEGYQTDNLLWKQ